LFHYKILFNTGKVFHPGKSSSNDDPVSWTEPYRHGLSTEPDYLKPFGPGERWLEVTNSLMILLL